MTQVTNQQQDERTITLRFQHLSDEARAMLPPVDDLTVDGAATHAALAALLWQTRASEEFCVHPNGVNADGWCGHAAWAHSRGVYEQCAEDDAETVRRSVLVPTVEERTLFVHDYQPGRYCPEADEHPDEWDGTAETVCKTCYLFSVVNADGSAVVPLRVLEASS